MQLRPLWHYRRYRLWRARPWSSWIQQRLAPWSLTLYGREPREGRTLTLPCKLFAEKLKRIERLHDEGAQLTQMTLVDRLAERQHDAVRPFVRGGRNCPDPRRDGKRPFLPHGDGVAPDGGQPFSHPVRPRRIIACQLEGELQPGAWLFPDKPQAPQLGGEIGQAARKRQCGSAGLPGPLDAHAEGPPEPGEIDQISPAR